MKKTAVITISVVFVFHLLALRFPHGDANLDGRVELSDAILAVRGLQNSTDAEAGPTGPKFSVEMKKALDAFKTVAEEKSFTTDGEKKAVPVYSTVLALSSSSTAPTPNPGHRLGPPKAFLPNNIILDLSTPPPRNVAA